MKVALSSTYWRYRNKEIRERVARVLQTCDIIYTTKENHVTPLAHHFPNAEIRLRTRSLKERRRLRILHKKDEVIDFDKLFAFIHCFKFQRYEDGHVSCNLIKHKEDGEDEYSEETANWL